MKMKIKVTRNQVLVAGGVLTFAAGVGTGLLIGKSKYEKFYAEVSKKEIEDARQHYAMLNKSDEYADLSKLAAKYNDPEKSKDNDPEKSKDNPSKIDLSKYEEKIEKFNYAGVEPAEQSEEEKVHVEAEISLVDMEFDYEAEEEVRGSDYPYVISREEYFQGERNYEQISLTYWENDDALVDENSQPVDDPEATVGGSVNLDKFGYGSKDPNIVFVRNEQIEVDFEIARSFGSIAEEVYGLHHSDDYGPKIRKFRGGYE